MYTNTQKLSSPQTKDLRKAGGQLLKDLREKAGHTQRSFAAATQTPEHIFVSQIECGFARIPPDRLRVWARAYGLSARSLLRAILPFYDPDTATLVFGSDPRAGDDAAGPDLDGPLAEARAIIADRGPAAPFNAALDDPAAKTAEARRLRESMGQLLKQLRERAGHSQRSFAPLVGSTGYTAVSHIENGRKRVPPEQADAWAEAYGISPKAFLLVLLHFYDPETFDILFGDDAAHEDSASVSPAPDRPQADAAVPSELRARPKRSRNADPEAPARRRRLAPS